MVMVDYDIKGRQGDKQVGNKIGDEVVVMDMVGVREITDNLQLGKRASGTLYGHMGQNPRLTQAPTWQPATQASSLAVAKAWTEE